MKFLAYSLFFSTLLFTACTDDGAANAKLQQLAQRWEIREASRNGRITESLDQLYFDFTADGTLKTNLSGATETGTYEMNDDQILQRGTQIEADYNVVNLSDTLLVLTTKIRNSSFKFELVPVPASAE